MSALKLGILFDVTEIERVRVRDSKGFPPLLLDLHALTPVKPGPLTRVKLTFADLCAAWVSLTLLVGQEKEYYRSFWLSDSRDQKGRIELWSCSFQWT